MPELIKITQQQKTAAAPPKPWPVRVISLTDSFERRKLIKSQLEGLSIPFTFVDAIDGRKGLAPEFEPMIDRPGTEEQFGRQMTDAEYACALSHMAIYRMIVDENLPGAVVLEDDAIIGPLFGAFLDAQGYEAGELIQLDHLQGGIWRFGRRLRPIANVELARASKNACLTTGYTISKLAAAHILRHGLPLRGPADWPCDIVVLRTMLALPCIVGHPDVESGGSSIEAERALLFWTRRKKNRSFRFFKAGYWRNWWRKRMTKRVS